MDIATRLRALLKQRGLKQSEVAELAGLPNETVNRIVTGTTKNPGAYTLAKLGDGIGVTVGWMLGEKASSFPSRIAWSFGG